MCPKERHADLHPYTVKLLRIRAMVEGGYPLQADDLTPDEWMDLGEIKKLFNPPLICPLMGREK